MKSFLFLNDINLAASKVQSLFRMIITKNDYQILKILELKVKIIQEKERSVRRRQKRFMIRMILEVVMVC